ncbi:MAG: Asp-tRNA(Asn)/Glu-tRNA(Gln) amidotransferase subunit GatA [Acidimicrobiia bacterium]
MTAPADLTVAEVGDALRAGELSAVDLLDSVSQRAAVTEAELHSFLHIDHDGARQAAERADKELAAGEDRGPLHGIPMAIKDNMTTRGIATTCASQILEGYVPPYDATVVKRLREAGAIIFGKANLDEFAMGSSTENSGYGPTRNPWDTSRVPGGSSGGAAAAVAAGSALAALGSDTGGSIRQPASLCGVVGMKPTYGLVSRYGLVAFASSLDQIGPLAKTVEDSARVLAAVAGHDPCDATSYSGDTPDFLTGMMEGVAGLRVGVVQELAGEGIDPEVKASLDGTIAALASAGAEVSQVSLPAIAHALSAYYLIAPAECSANLARFDGVRYGLRVDGSSVEDMMGRTRAAGFGPEVTRRILLGTYALSAGYYDAFYGQAQKVRTLVISDFERAYESSDVLVSPTSPTTAFELGARTEDPLSMYLSDICTIPSNLAGSPAISVPVGLDARGLPIGFQVMAPPLGEGAMFRCAAAVEGLAAFSARPPLVEAA